MEPDIKEDVLIPEVMPVIQLNLLNCPMINNDRINPETNIVFVDSDKEYVKPIERDLVEEVDGTFPKLPVPQKQAKFSFGWKRPSGKLVNAKVNTANKNIVNKKPAGSKKKVPNIVNKTLLHSVSNGQLKHNLSEITRISDAHIKFYSREDTHTSTSLDTLDESPPVVSIPPSANVIEDPLAGVQEDLEEYYSSIQPAANVMKDPVAAFQEEITKSFNTFIQPAANVIKDPVDAFRVEAEKLDRKKKELAGFQAGMEKSDRKKKEVAPFQADAEKLDRKKKEVAVFEAEMEKLKERKLKERRRASPEPDSRERSRSPQRGRHHKHRRPGHHKQSHRPRHHSPLRKRSHHRKRSRHRSHSSSPPLKRTKILDLRDKINSPSPSPKTTIRGDLRHKVNSRTPSPERSKMYLRDKINSGRACRRKKKVVKSRTPPPADYSKLDDNQSQNLIKSKLTKLSLGSLKSLRTSLLNELLEQPLIDLLDEHHCPIQSAESNLKSLPPTVSAKIIHNDTLEPSESISDQQPTDTDGVSSGEFQASIPSMENARKQPSKEFIHSDEFGEFSFHSSFLPVDPHLTEFLIQEKFGKRARPSFIVSPVIVEENTTKKYGESLLHQQIDESLLPALSTQLRDDSSNVLKENKSSELSHQIVNDKINFSLTPFLKLEWQIKKISDISSSHEFEESERSDETFSPIVKLDWKLESQEMVSSASEFKEPIQSGKTDKNLPPVLRRKPQLNALPLPVPRSNVVSTSSAYEIREPLTSGLGLIRESYSKSSGIVDHPAEISPSVQNSIYSSQNHSSALPPSMSEVPLGSLTNPEVAGGSATSPVRSLLTPQVSVGYLITPVINPNILNCGLCQATCKRSVVLPCCLAQACNGCAVSAITKKRMCWGCRKPAKSTKELSQDTVLREAIEWFRKNGTIKREHGEKLIMRRKFIIEQKEKLSKLKKNKLFKKAPQLNKSNGVTGCEDTEVCGASQSRGKNNRTKAERKKGGNGKSSEKSKQVKKRESSRRQFGRSSDNNNDRRKQKIPDETKSSTKIPEIPTKTEEVSVITRVKRKLLERIESLQHDQERLCLAKSEFQNPICSDPTLNLTFHGYRRRKLFVMQDENVDSFYDFDTIPEVVKHEQVKSEERQMFYLKAGDTVSMPGFKKVFKMDKAEDNSTAEEIKEIVRAEEFKVLLENEFQKNHKPLKKSKGSLDNFKTQFSHFQAAHAEGINFLQFYKSELGRRQVEEIVYLENLYKKCAIFYGKTKPMFCKSCNVNHKF